MPANSTLQFCLFATALGPCGIAWGSHGIRAVQLPEADQRRTRARLLRALPPAEPAAAPPEIRRVIEDIAGLLRGEPRDLRAAQLDMRELTAFRRRVYEVTRAIDPGRTLSYGEVAAACGERAATRAVGQALGHNPYPIIVPCHRVLAAGGKSGGFSARGGVVTKLRLLCLEGWPRAASGPSATVDSSTISAAMAAGNLPLPF